jgi:hypothetical protein
MGRAWQAGIGQITLRLCDTISTHWCGDPRIFEILSVAIVA